jgi:hypothetical protein
MDSGMDEDSSVFTAAENYMSASDFCFSISRTEEEERIAQEHINFVLDFEEMEAVFGPLSLPHRLLTDRENPLAALRPGEFRVMFGMGKLPFRQIFDMIQPELERIREGQSPTVLPAMHRFIIFLQFMRTNAFQRAVGTQRFIRVSQSVVCTTVNEVSRLLAGKVAEFVQFPSEEEAKHISEEIYLQTGMPGVIGVADGTHFEITKPLVHHPAPEKFFNRKHYYREFF